MTSKPYSVRWFNGKEGTTNDYATELEARANFEKMRAYLYPGERVELRVVTVLDFAEETGGSA